jgi:putative membrane protein
MAAEARRLLVLCVDVDDDLGVKARQRGPVVGRKANLAAASKLALADPRDSDANTMFEAVRAADELSKHYRAEVVTLTGDSRGGYAADREVVRQLEKVIADFVPEACVFVSDGASDERVLPLVQTRLKVNSVRTVTVKQAKELESTYVAVLEKLKEPAFARIVFGIPGLILLFFALSEFIGVRVIIALLGAYLILKALGVEEWLFRRVGHLEVSREKISFVAYFAAIPLVILSLVLAATRVAQLQAAGLADPMKLSAWFVKDALLLIPVALLLIIAGRTVESLQERRPYELPSHAINFSVVVLFWAVLATLADWVVGTTSFGDFFNLLVLGTIAAVLVIYLAKEFRRSLLARLKLEGREVYTEIGAFIGKVVGVNRKRETLLVQNPSGQTFDLRFEHVASLGDKIVIRY